MVSGCQRFLVFAALAVVIQGPNCFSQPTPSLINYQGKLTDAAGNPLPNGTYGVAFRIWNKRDAALPGNTLIWGQEYNVAIVNGVFNVILGAPGGLAIPEAAVNDLAFAFTEPERYFALSVTRGPNGASFTNSVILPRQQVLTTPYSFYANKAVTANLANSANALDAPNGGPTNVVFVKQDGTVGIGTTNPTASLEILGQIKISGGSPGPGKVLTSDGNGLAAWQNSVPHGVQIFNSSGTFTPPPGVSNVLLTMVGGGGGGGGSLQNGPGGGGGGGGAAVVNFPCLVVPGGAYAVVIGIGGPGGNNYDSGEPGSQSSFDSRISANGGHGGSSQLGGGDNAGGAGGPNQNNGNKFAGGNGSAPGTQTRDGGRGGGSLVGDGANGGARADGTSANPNSGGGGGGGGGAGDGGTRGGNGGSGIVIITY